MYMYLCSGIPIGQAVLRSEGFFLGNVGMWRDTLLEPAFEYQVARHPAAVVEAGRVEHCIKWNETPYSSTQGKRMQL